MIYIAMSSLDKFEIQIVSSVDNVGEKAWDALSSEQPFQSARWYRFGERVMEGCQSIYIILTLDNRPVARGTFWLIRNEPLPVHPLARSILTPFLHHWPLLICRSPLSNSSGLILPDAPLRNIALNIIIQAAFMELGKSGGSFLIFDYLDSNQAEWPDWPPGLTKMQIGDPGTMLSLKWDRFEEYLEAGQKFRIRQHFKRSSRQAIDLGIKVTREDSCNDPSSALQLIKNVERRHGSAPNLWARKMLENMTMVEHNWLEAYVDNRLVGCLLLLEDTSVQIAALPGLTDDVPFAYFMLLYEAIQEACEKKLSLLRWGSGAYETKRRLGFELEYENHVIFGSRGLIPKLVTHLT